MAVIQVQILNKVLKTKDPSIIINNNLTEDYFSGDIDEFNYIKNHLNVYGKVPDIETFLNVFDNFDVIDVTEPDSYLLDELYKDKRRRDLVFSYNKVKDCLKSDDIQGAIETLRKAAESSYTGTNITCTDIISDTSRYDRYLEKMEAGSKYFISTGFPELDKITGGWDAKEELATIVARNGLGKTFLLLKFAVEAFKQGKNVGIYSGEMSADKVGYRIDTMFSHISNGALIHGGMSVKNEYKKYIDDLNSKGGHIKVLTPKDINGPAGVSALRAFIEKENIDILFIDQHSLLEDDRKGKTPVEKASNISKDLKLLQVTKQIPIISVCQQNREKLENDRGDKVFDTTQLAQSDRIAQDSSQIIFIERKDDIMKLHLVKSRDSECGNVLSYKVDLNRGLFQYIPEETDDQVTDSENNTYTEDDVF